MQELTDQNQEPFSHETARKVQNKPEHTKARFQLIPEEYVQDLEYVDVAGRLYCIAKRVMDVFLSSIGILLLLIPFLVISAAIYIDDPGKVIFSQYRVGRYGRYFRLYKFRTMKEDTPKYLSTMEIQDPDRYITRIGHVLRRASLDELPQLINVWKGDMSLVGPRPLIPGEYEIHQMRMRFGVYNIRPGLTGLAQINGRDKVSPADKVRWDVKYLQKFGFLTDTYILIKTVPRLSGDENVVEGCAGIGKEKEDAVAENSYMVR